MGVLKQMAQTADSQAKMSFQATMFWGHLLSSHRDWDHR